MVTNRRSRQAPAKKGNAPPPKTGTDAPSVDAQGFLADLTERIPDD